MIRILAVLSFASADYCESKALSYAHCTGSVDFTSGSCEDVIAVITGRAAGSASGKWVDPHNKGAYLLEGNSTSEVDVKRVTGNGKYTDKMSFKFTSAVNGTQNGCKVEVCSKSQIFSISDFGTNWCNLHDLYCSDSQCHPLAGEPNLAYTEDLKCSSGQTGTSNCYKV